MEYVFPANLNLKISKINNFQNSVQNKNRKINEFKSGKTNIDFKFQNFS